MALHEQCVGQTDEWYTPPYIFEAMRMTFDVDVATHPLVHWVPAHRRITRSSLDRPWDGFVWMNPPFGKRNGLMPWLEKFIAHRNGVCLVPDRTSAPWWQFLAANVDLILFVSPKIKFLDAAMMPGKSPAQGTCLCSLGQRGAYALENAHRLGTLMKPVSPAQSKTGEG